MQGRTLSDRYREHFYKVREKFRSDINEIPAASKIVRLHWLNHMVEKALDAGDDYKAASYIEQAAKEMGGTFRF